MNRTFLVPDTENLQLMEQAAAMTPDVLLQVLPKDTYADLYASAQKFGRETAALHARLGIAESEQPDPLIQKAVLQLRAGGFVVRVSLKHRQEPHGGLGAFWDNHQALKQAANKTTI